MIMGIKPRVVFFLGFAAVAIPSVGFLLASYFTLEQTVDLIHANQSRETLNYLRSLSTEPNNADTLRETIRAYLDYDTLNNRQGRANSALASRTWLRFMSMGFGAVLAFVGAVFVLAKIETRVDSTLGAEEQSIGMGISVRSTSPGIIMVLIGALLIAAPLFARQKITTWDSIPPSPSEVAKPKQLHNRVSPEVKERLRQIQ